MAKTINGEAQIHDKVDGKKLSVPIESVADEAIYKELNDKLVRAATTASSLEAEQDSGNINRTQSKATLNESSFQETSSGGGPRVIDLEKTKTTQANEIDSLKRRVKKLERRNKSRTHKLKRLYNVCLTAKVESSDSEESLGEDTSKQGRRIDDIDGDEDITLVNVQDDAEMFDADKDLGGKEEVVIDVIPLAVKSRGIVNWKIHKEGKKSYYQIIRADGKSKMYMFFSQKLTSFDREDLYKLVLRRYIKIDTELLAPVEKDEIISELTTPLSALGEFAVPLQLPKSLPLPEGKVNWTLDDATQPKGAKSHDELKTIEVEEYKHFPIRLRIRRMVYLQYGRSILRQSKVLKDTSESVLHHPLFYAAQGVRYRKLEVILTTNVDKLGKAGKTVKVAPGHFRNHLMPKLLAVPNIDKFAYLIAEQRKIYQPKEVEEIKVLRRYIKIDTELLTPVEKDEIISEVARQLGVRIEPENLQLTTPLSALGEFAVPLQLPKSLLLPEGKVNWTVDDLLVVQNVISEFIVDCAGGALLFTLA
nr:ribosomal protein L9/RNase H1 [Tanacetum cinerariifolium]